MAFDVTRFHASLRTRVFGRNLLYEPVVGSTMDVARDAAAHGAAEGTLALADEQTAGRGRLGRSWITPPGVNLASTLILRPPQTVLRAIAMLTPVAIATAVEDLVGVRPGLKWPNDVQVDGRKLAGVLVETLLAEGEEPVVLVGVGINVNFDARAYPEVADVATSLQAELGRDVSREELLAAYLLQMERLYDAVRGGDSMVSAWRSRLVTLGREVRATWPGGSVEGTAEDVDEDGALLVRAGGALVRVEAGDVTLR